MSEKITTHVLEELLTNPQKKVKLHKLVHDETEKVYKLIEGSSTQTTDVQSVAKREITEFENGSENLRLIMAYVAYFGTPEQSYLLEGVLNCLGNMPQVAGSTFLIDLQLFPALLVMYAAGIGATAAKNFKSLDSIFASQATSQTINPTKLSALANCTLLGANGSELLGFEAKRKTPLSDHLHDLFKNTLPRELVFGGQFDDIFDRWEIMLSMFVADIHVRGPSHAWAPVGRFGWRQSHTDTDTLKIIHTEITQDGQNWPPLTVGLFGGDAKRASAAHTVVKELAERVSFWA